MSHISPSELVLNADGSIYHLNLHPEEIAPIILTVGDPGRVSRVSRHFDRIEVRKEKREFITHTGWVGRRRLSVISTGIGPDNIDIVLNELDALVNIDLDSRVPKDDLTQLRLIRIGTSGCIQPDLPVDSFVAARFGLGFDNLLTFYEYRPNLVEATLFDELSAYLDVAGHLPVMPYVCEGSASLARAIGSNMHSGITITAPGFYGPQGRRLRLQSRLTAGMVKSLANFSQAGMRILNFEMETAPLFGLTRMLGHQALSCNVLIANRATGTFSADPHAAIDRLIVEVLEKVERLGA